MTTFDGGQYRFIDGSGDGFFRIHDSQDLIQDQDGNEISKSQFMEKFPDFPEKILFLQDGQSLDGTQNVSQAFAPGYARVQNPVQASRGLKPGGGLVALVVAGGAALIGWAFSRDQKSEPTPGVTAYVPGHDGAWVDFTVPKMFPGADDQELTEGEVDPDLNPDLGLENDTNEFVIYNVTSQGDIQGDDDDAPEPAEEPSPERAEELERNRQHDEAAEMYEALAEAAAEAGNHEAASRYYESANTSLINSHTEGLEFKAAEMMYLAGQQAVLAENTLEALKYFGEALNDFLYEGLFDRAADAWSVLLATIADAGGFANVAVQRWLAAHLKDTRLSTSGGVFDMFDTSSLDEIPDAVRSLERGVVMMLFAQDLFQQALPHLVSGSTVIAEAFRHFVSDVRSSITELAAEVSSDEYTGFGFDFPYATFESMPYLPSGTDSNVVFEQLGILIRESALLVRFLRHVQDGVDPDPQGPIADVDLEGRPYYAESGYNKAVEEAAELDAQRTAEVERTATRQAQVTAALEIAAGINDGSGPLNSEAAEECTKALANLLEHTDLDGETEILLQALERLLAGLPSPASNQARQVLLESLFGVLVRVNQDFPRTLAENITPEQLLGLAHAVEVGRIALRLVPADIELSLEGGDAFAADVEAIKYFGYIVRNLSRDVKKLVESVPDGHAAFGEIRDRQTVAELTETIAAYEEGLASHAVHMSGVVGAGPAEAEAAARASMAEFFAAIERVDPELVVFHLEEFQRALHRMQVAGGDINDLNKEFADGLTTALEALFTQMDEILTRPLQPGDGTLINLTWRLFSVAKPFLFRQMREDVTGRPEGELQNLLTLTEEMAKGLRSGVSDSTRYYSFGIRGQGILTAEQLMEAFVDQVSGFESHPYFDFLEHALRLARGFATVVDAAHEIQDPQPDRRQVLPGEYNGLAMWAREMLARLGYIEEAQAIESFMHDRSMANELSGTIVD